MSEQTQRGRVIRALRPLHAKSVENRVGPGTPDVNYIEGWIELKWLRRWPRNAEASPVLIEHFTPQQRVWLRRRWELGGNAHLLLQVGHEWLLFRGDVAAEHVGRVTRPELYRLAAHRWTKGLRDEELRECLTRDLESSRR